MSDETKKEPTTEELLATARLPLGWLGGQGAVCREAHGDADVALAELERRMGALERTHRLAREQIESMRAECRRCWNAGLDPADVAEGLERLLRILGNGPEGHS